MADRLGLYIIVPSNAVRDVIRRTGARCLLLMNEAIVLADEFPDLYTIARDQGTFLDCPDLPHDLEECRALGYRMGRIMLARIGRPSIKAYMGPNERTPETIEGAFRRGAFEAGVAQAVWDTFANADYIAGNFSVGTPKGSLAQGYGAPIFVAFWRTLLSYVGARRVGQVKIGYHGYCDWVSMAYFMELRPWRIWKPAIEAAGLPWAGVYVTEAFIDLGTPENNGYRNSVGSENMAVYISQMPKNFAQAEGVCGFGCGMTDDWKAKGFDFMDDEVVLRAIEETNAAQPIPLIGGKTMPTDLAHEIWDMAWRWPQLPPTAGYNPNTAITAYRTLHTMPGLPLSNEYTRDTWPVVIRPFTDGSVILSRKGDWKTVAAYSEQDVRNQLAGPLA